MYSYSMVEQPSEVMWDLEGPSCDQKEETTVSNTQQMFLLPSPKAKYHHHHNHHQVCLQGIVEEVHQRE